MPTDYFGRDSGVLKTSWTRGGHYSADTSSSASDFADNSGANVMTTLAMLMLAMPVIFALVSLAVVAAVRSRRRALNGDNCQLHSHKSP